MKWWQTNLNTVESTEKGFVVVEAKLGNPNGITDKLLSRPAILDSEVVRDLLEQTRRGLTITHDEHGNLLRADLSFLVNAERKEMV